MDEAQQRIAWLERENAALRSELARTKAQRTKAWKDRAEIHGRLREKQRELDSLSRPPATGL